MKLNTGDRWYVQFHKNGTLLPMEIVSKTEKTIVLANLINTFDIPSRFAIKNLKFIERVIES